MSMETPDVAATSGYYEDARDIIDIEATNLYDDRLCFYTMTLSYIAKYDYYGLCYDISSASRWPTLYQRKLGTNRL